SSSAGTDDVFVAKYSASCALRWVRSFGASTDDAGYGIAADPNGDLVVAGYFRGAADFGNGAVLSANSNADVFVAKYAGATGAYRWARTLIGAGIHVGNAAAVDGEGNVVIAGSFQMPPSDGATLQPLLTGAR